MLLVGFPCQRQGARKPGSRGIRKRANDLFGYIQPITKLHSIPRQVRELWELNVPLQGLRLRGSLVHVHLL